MSRLQGGSIFHDRDLACALALSALHRGAAPRAPCVTTPRCRGARPARPAPRDALFLAKALACDLGLGPRRSSVERAAQSPRVHEKETRVREGSGPRKTLDSEFVMQDRDDQRQPPDRSRQDRSLRRSATPVSPPRRTVSRADAHHDPEDHRAFTRHASYGRRCADRRAPSCLGRAADLVGRDRDRAGITDSLKQAPARARRCYSRSLRSRPEAVSTTPRCLLPPSRSRSCRAPRNPRRPSRQAPRPRACRAQTPRAGRRLSHRRCTHTPGSDNAPRSGS
jgi:hypothetical protein